MFSRTKKNNFKLFQGCCWSSKYTSSTYLICSIHWALWYTCDMQYFWHVSMHLWKDQLPLWFREFIYNLPLHSIIQSTFAFHTVVAPSDLNLTGSSVWLWLVALSSQLQHPLQQNHAQNCSIPNGTRLLPFIAVVISFFLISFPETTNNLLF